MPANITETKKVYEGWISLLQATLRLDDGKKVTREVITHGRVSAV
jgi:hypothetical protein